MRSPTALLFAFATLSLTQSAFADPKEQCRKDYSDAQELRKDGKLAAARDKALACSTGACADWEKADCTNWIADIDKAMPTVVLVVQDASGAETTKVK